MEQVNQVGDWKCVKILGKGSFGVVALWKNVINGQHAAIKQFEVRNPSQRGANDRLLNDLKERWKKEVDIMYNVVKSSFIVSTVPLPNAFRTDPILSKLQSPLLCLEYCVAGDLRHLLKRPENIAGLPENDVRNFLDHIGQAISYLHERNIVHRDIKPENILLQQTPMDASTSKAQISFKLGDLGFAKDLSDSQSLCSTVVGTLQYLAPEIYMGKKYDRTVDYWSLALIAFEVICGMRPFLHGESPSKWIPFVEDKENDVISIFRNEEGQIEFSKTIPYDTHLTDVFKQCIEQWLKIMLQLDPTKRGCKISSHQTGAGDMATYRSNLYGLNSLPVLLSHKRLEIFTPTKRMGFVIGRSTTILDVKNNLSRHLGLTVDNQLIVTIDGALVQSNELASKFADVTGLYLIPKIFSWYRSKIKLPRIMHNFLQTWEGFRDPLNVRKIWSSTIYFMQSELEKLETLRRMSNALRLWIANSIAVDLKSTKAHVEKSFHSLSSILELEHKLSEIDDAFGFKFNAETSEHSCDPTENLSDENEVVNLQTYYRETAEDANLVLSPVRTSELEELYHKVLRHYEDWRSEEFLQSNSNFNEDLLRCICQFIAQRDPVLDAVPNNIAKQLEYAELQEKKISKLTMVSSKVESIMHRVMTSRCQKQKQLLESIFDKSSPQGESQPKVPGMSRNKDSTNTKSERKITKRMCKSDTPTLPAEGLKQNHTMSLDGARGEVRERSLKDLMQESQELQFETVNTIANAQKTLNRLLKETHELDWEFIDFD